VRIGIFGGSFDPPHVGHLILAQDAMAALSLDRLLVIPTATQPFKRGARTGADDRWTLVEATFGGVAGVEVHRLEIDRGGVSFTIDTVEALRPTAPNATWVLLLGDDAFRSMPRWHRADALVRLVDIAVLTRSGTDTALATAAMATVEMGGTTISARRVTTRRIEIASSEIRERLYSGLSIRGFVTDRVADIIETTGMYRPEAVDAAHATHDS
jgi:nicotinate-nucleotide adenylyltransferase